MSFMIYRRNLLIRSPYAVVHCSFEMTVTFISWSVDDCDPSEEVSPHPITVAKSPVYREGGEAGRQMAAAAWEKLTGAASVSTEKS